MQVAQPFQASWHASLALRFERRQARTVLAERRANGPLAVQKALYPEGPDLCHAIVVHPPGGIAGGDDLSIEARCEPEAAALLTTPGAAKWYRSSGPLARQRLCFEVDGALEWLPRETIVFDGAFAELGCEVRLGAQARYIGWDIVCLGRTGSGERYAKGNLKLSSSITREGKPLWIERAELAGGGKLLHSPVGLAGCPVFGTLVATEVPAALAARCRAILPVTLLPGVMLARYLGDSTEKAFEAFSAVWSLVRPVVLGRPALAPRIWST